LPRVVRLADEAPPRPILAATIAPTQGISLLALQSVAVCSTFVHVLTKSRRGLSAKCITRSSRTASHRAAFWLNGHWPQILRRIESLGFLSEDWRAAQQRADEPA